MSLTKTYFNSLDEHELFPLGEMTEPHSPEDFKWAIEMAINLNEKRGNESKSVYFTRIKADAFLILQTLKDLRNDS